MYAAEKGHLKVLQWLRGQKPPCPWIKEQCMDACEGSGSEVEQWLQESEECGDFGDFRVFEELWPSGESEDEDWEIYE